MILIIKRVIGRHIGGWIVITVCYFIVFFAASTMYTFVTHLPVDRNRDASGTFIGISLIIIPYFVAGLYVSKQFEKIRGAALVVSLIPVVCERVLIYVMGSLLASMGGDSSMNGVNVLMFIRAEAAPYYTSIYIWCGALSVLVCMATASFKRKQDMAREKTAASQHP